MLTEFRASAKLQEHKQKWCVLSLGALLGTGFGVLFAVLAGSPYILLMRMAAGRPVSIVGSLTAVCVPYIVSFLAVSYTRPWFAYSLCWVRFFLFAAAGWGIVQAFGSSGWLVQLLFQFPDICLIPLLILRCMGRHPGNKRVTAICIVCTVLIGIIYYCSISPFLADLIETYETMGRYAIHVGLDRRL